jgi:DnaJ-class molecular chaperone
MIKKEINMNDSEVCPSCKGAGGWDEGDCEDGIWEMCPECDGLGEIQ